MADILHGVGIRSSLRDVHQALATRDGLAGWWATNRLMQNSGFCISLLTAHCASHHQNLRMRRLTS